MITLRALEPDDIDILYKTENEMSAWDCGNSNVPYSRELLLQYVLSQTGDIYADKQVRLVICVEGNATGLVDLTDFDPKNLRAEVGIMLLPEYRGQGIATEALSQLIDYAKGILHLHQLYATIPSKNQASLKLFRNSGFASEKVIEDWLYDGKEYSNAILAQMLFR